MKNAMFVVLLVAAGLLSAGEASKTETVVVKEAPAVEATSKEPAKEIVKQREIDSAGYPIYEADEPKPIGVWYSVRGAAQTTQAESGPIAKCKNCDELKAAVAEIQKHPYRVEKGVKVHAGTGAPIYGENDEKPIGVWYHVVDKDGNFIGGGGGNINSPCVTGTGCSSGKCSVPISTSSCSSGKCSASPGKYKSKPAISQSYEIETISSGH